MNPEARTYEQRKRDTLQRLDNDIDLWVSTCPDHGGMPYLVPLSFSWDGATVLVATSETAPTGRNLGTNGRVRLGLGHTRDVVMIEGAVEEVIPTAQMSAAEGNTFAAKTGFEPRKLTGFCYFRILPVRIQAWREVNEIASRDLMRDGAWLDDR